MTKNTKNKAWARWLKPDPILKPSILFSPKKKTNKSKKYQPSRARHVISKFPPQLCAANVTSHKTLFYFTYSHFLSPLSRSSRPQKPENSIHPRSSISIFIFFSLSPNPYLSPPSSASAACQITTLIQWNTSSNHQITPSPLPMSFQMDGEDWKSLGINWRVSALEKEVRKSLSWVSFNFRNLSWNFVCVSWFFKVRVRIFRVRVWF